LSLYFSANERKSKKTKILERVTMNFLTCLGIEASTTYQLPYPLSYGAEIKINLDQIFEKI
jgi:hypothetical protein